MWVIAVLIFISITTVAFASFTDTKINVSFRNIKIIHNGKTVKTEFEPFIYNGHVYVALKDIAKIFSSPIKWESKDNTVILGTKEKRFYSLSEIPFMEEKLKEQSDGSFVNVGSSYNETLSGIRFATINGRVFKNALVFAGSGTEYFKFPLNRRFSYLSFIAGVTDNSMAIAADDYVIIKIYGDSRLIYTSPPLKPNKGAVFVRIPVKNIDVLKIEKEIHGSSILNAAVANSELALTKGQ